MRLIGYTRTSTSAGNGDSHEHQAEKIEAWASAHGHDIAALHPDDGLSGAFAAEERAGLTAALNDLRDGEAKGIVVHRLDRLARELHVQEAILAEVWKLGGSVFSAVEGEQKRDDPDDPMRTFVRQVMGAAAQLERGMIRARLQGGRKRKRAKGGYIGGNVPYGHALDEDGTLVPVPEQQVVIRRIRRQRREGWSYGLIADKLNAKNVPTPSGQRWYPMTVKLIVDRYEREAA